MSNKAEKVVEQVKESVAETTSEGDSPTQVLLRGLYMVLFVIITNLAQYAIGGAALIQLIYKLSTKKTNDRVTAFGDSLAQYITQIVRFQTFNSEEKPFPFQSWPAAAVVTATDTKVSEETPPTQPQAS